MTTLRDGRLAEGLQRLTLMYDDPRLTADQNQAIARSAGQIGRHRRVFAETLASAAIRDQARRPLGNDRRRISGSGRAVGVKINASPIRIIRRPGEKLKSIRGPFMALVNLNQRELTLVVQQCYAGRFNLAGVGKDAAAMKGVYKVDRKSLDTPNHPSDLASRIAGAASLDRIFERSARIVRLLWRQQSDRGRRAARRDAQFPPTRGTVRHSVGRLEHRRAVVGKLRSAVVTRGMLARQSVYLRHSGIVANSAWPLLTVTRVYDKQTLIELVRSRALKFGEFTLASGKKASYYSTASK